VAILSSNFKDNFRMIVAITVSNFVKICYVLKTILHKLTCREPLILRV